MILCVVCGAASETRNVEPNYATVDEVMFSDQYPFLLASQVN